MMDPELKAKWLVALRSGEYAQSHGALKRDGGYCCLGVLDEVGHLNCVPQPDMQLYRPLVRALSPSRPEGDCLDAVSTLINMNDDEKRSFNDIADWIELHL